MRISFLKTSKIALIALWLLPLLSFATSRTIYSPVNEKSITDFWVLREAATTSLKPWPNGEPGLAAWVQIPASKGYPSARLQIPEELQDWRSAKTLRIELFCPERCQIEIEIAPKNKLGGRNMSWYDRKFGPGRTAIELNIEELQADWDLSSVVFIDLFSAKPKREFSFYVGDVKLELKNPFQEAAEHKAAATALKESLSWRLEALGTSRAKDHRAIQGMSESLPEAPDIDQLANFQSFCKDEFPKMDKEIFRGIAQGGLGILWCLPEEKIHRGDYAFLAPPADFYSIDAARGEGESAQLVAYAEDAATNVKAVIVSAPVSANGTVLPMENIKLSPVGLIDCPCPAYVIDYIGYWPDPILEYLDTPFDIEEGVFQTWWLDVKVPENQKPGRYEGSVEITWDGGLKDMPFVVNVHNFKLEKGPAYFSPVSFSPLSDYPESASARAKYKDQIADLLIENRLNPDDIYYGPRSDASTMQMNKRIIEQGGKYFNLGYVNGEITDEDEAKLAEIYEEYKKMDLLDHAYIYSFDEATHDKFPLIRKSLERVRRACPGIPIATTLYDDTFGLGSGLDDLVDIWIPGTISFSANAESIKAARERGRKVGWYVACAPWLPYANYLLEYPALAPRLLMGFMPQKLNNDDIFLYYHSSIFWNWIEDEKGDDRHKGDIKVPISGGPVIQPPWSGRSFGQFNGDGRLVYPAANGPIPSLRLKYIRDGVDDWMYMELLKQCLKNSSRMPVPWRRAAETELKVEDAIVTSHTIWTRNPLLVYAKRARLLRLLDEYFQ
ncbi:MAG: DUF4091 domain-containing protein [Lentisphaeria bacterium]|nr:DUF4091 domain-containing protein [Lentisphaeria bacterium]